VITLVVLVVTVVTAAELIRMKFCTWILWNTHCSIYVG